MSWRIYWSAVFIPPKFGHYRQQFNFTLNALEAARSGLDKLEAAMTRLLKAAGLEQGDWAALVRPEQPASWGPFANAWQALKADLNTPAVLGALFSGAKLAANTDDPAAARTALAAAGALFFALGVPLFVRPAANEPVLEIPASVTALADARWEAKKARDFARADQLRQQISDKGWLVVDRPNGYALQNKS